MAPLITDPRHIRHRTFAGLDRLGLGGLPDRFPLAFSPNDRPRLRSRSDIEARAAILNVVQARVFDMPEDMAMRWLLDAHVLDELTPGEWGFIACGRGDRILYADQLESLFALAWILGLAHHLDPTTPCSEDLPDLLPDLRAPESLADWRGRRLPAQRDPGEIAEMLDLYYCLDWMCEQAHQSGMAPPHGLDANLIWHRRWALEWALVFSPTNAPRWDQIQL
ncbi:DUF4272 domain-containing protein [Natronoglycomyces albus]|uniref:DUF4272 domain-containing protein n=1 Tax=Natronoglycomyces albus TaxID=2811108 RepID=A0A895XW26_9ACTN|nr:DUF4272 domain-containing protein [Natronoglycomyces albus]QSB05838.1 DUF4272 domain-containing protein [Natronoglycomyces albus]